MIQYNKRIFIIQTIFFLVLINFSTRTECDDTQDFQKNSKFIIFLFKLNEIKLK